MIKSLLLAGALALLPLAAVGEPATHPTRTERPQPMPPVVVLIVCKTVVVGPPDHNADYTKAENREWATENSMMVCRREEVQMTDQAGDTGSADPQPFNLNRCMMSAMMLGANWDASHPSSKYRFWRVACPVPIINRGPDGRETIIGYKLPECGHRDTVVCLVDSEI